jgi:hypothetical protein
MGIVDEGPTLPRRAARVRREEAAQAELSVGQWYWVKSEEYTSGGGKRTVERLACITRLGTNYAKLVAPVGQHSGSCSWRIHFDEFDSECRPEPDAQSVIDREIATHRGNVQALMLEIRDLTMRLGVSPRPALQDGSEARAISLRTDATPVKEYKAALVKAQKETLPKLFERIKNENEAMAAWMTGALLPLQGQVNQLRPAIKAVEARVLNVEIYAGLTEQVVQIQDGAPAPLAERIHLFQRRHYMDEECLADYRAGGMSFHEIAEFDRWLLEPANLQRLLPLPRCVVAFRVRRNDKEHDFSLSEWISFSLNKEGDLDKLTFLYLRNGEQVWRLKTAIEFGARLFPDLGTAELEQGKVYAHKHYLSDHDDPKLISERRYHAMQEEEAQEEARQEARRKADIARKKAGDKSVSSTDAIFYHVRRESEDYIPWTRENVHYDDIAAKVKQQVEHHNRLVLVLQGLLDRSQVFHPHPQWALWTAEGMAAALELLYDDARALSAGPPPDFEAYRARLNASLTAGSHTVGQEDAWEEREARRENERQRRDYRIRNRSDYKRFRPYGDPGPGTVATVVGMHGQQARFAWHREKRRQRWNDGENVSCALAVPTSRLLNVDAYTPGDFRQFYDDPRTRADYLQWAPLLLVAEDWHAAQATPSRKKKRGGK